MFTRKIQVVAINDGESLDLKYFSINELPCKRDVEERLFLKGREHFFMLPLYCRKTRQ